MNKNKLHMVPELIQDIGRSIESNKTPHIRELYLQRLEVIKEYCESVISKNKKFIK